MEVNLSAACGAWQHADGTNAHDHCEGKVHLPAPRNVCECECHADDRPTAPHRYVPTGAARWRTCALCGVGANASIHRTGA